LQISTPITVLLYEPSLSEKSEWTFRFINNREKIFTFKTNKVLYFYKVWQKRFNDLDNVEFYHGIPSIDELKHSGDCRF